MAALGLTSVSGRVLLGLAPLGLAASVFCSVWLDRLASAGLTSVLVLVCSVWQRSLAVIR